jgi:hypothetical protein
MVDVQYHMSTLFCESGIVCLCISESYYLHS